MNAAERASNAAVAVTANPSRREMVVATPEPNGGPASAQTEILATIDKILHVVGSTDKKRVEMALVSMKETQSVLVALAAIVADAIHSNCGHIHEHFCTFVDIMSLEGRR